MEKKQKNKQKHIKKKKKKKQKKTNQENKKTSKKKERPPRRLKIYFLKRNDTRNRAAIEVHKIKNIKKQKHFFLMRCCDLTPYDNAHRNWKHHSWHERNARVSTS